ncbi:MAG: 5'-methylthioadenosine/adenosylhomocysteine nucleosidase [Bacilli bacterium]|nr:5'-methylthioadenosine/adenosylhomocysteine nucleosidase [Bacilli bacterium]
MKIAIIGAMREEVEHLTPLLGHHKEHTIKPYTFHTGDYLHHELLIVESGVGKVMSGMLIATLYQHFTVDQVINVGVAGGLGDVQIGDIVVGTQCIYGDVDVSAGGAYLYGQMARCPLAFLGSETILSTTRSMDAIHATIMSNDAFITDAVKTKALIDEYFPDFDVRAVDMESCAFAQACYVIGLPFLAIRAISDVIGDKNQVSSFINQLEVACKSSNEFILNLLKRL